MPNIVAARRDPIYFNHVIWGALFTGVVLGILGAGGSMIILPVLLLGGFTAHLSSAFSLFIVGVAALGGGITHAIKGNVRWGSGLTFALPSVAGVWLARIGVLSRMPESSVLYGIPVTRDGLVLFVFLSLLAVAIVFMLRRLGQPATGEAAHPACENRFSCDLVRRGLATGFLTGLAGAGGGFLIVPALIAFAGLTMKEAVGTSLWVIATNTLLGFLAELHTAAKHWPLLTAFAVFAAGGTIVGSVVSRHISERYRQIAFIVLMMVAAVVTLWKITLSG